MTPPHSPPPLPPPLPLRHAGRTPPMDFTEEWDKVLWRKQPFPDNHVPASFLSELNDMPPRPRPNIIALVLAALPISQHVATIALFLGVFYSLLAGRLAAAQVGCACVALGLAGYLIHAYGWGRDSTAQAAQQDALIPAPTPFRQLILPPLLLALLSPVLASLTSATTSDSIWPLAGLLFFVHLLLADFSTGRDSRRRRRWQLRKMQEERKRRGSVSEAAMQRFVVEEKSLTSSLSLTSALSASIVLASRLPTTSHVFSLLLLAVLLFAGWPRIAKGVRESGKVFSISLTCSMALLALSFFPAASHSGVGGSDGPTMIFLAVLVLVNLGGPGALWWAWRWKTRRAGRWDAATVTLKRREARGRRG